MKYKIPLALALTLVLGCNPQTDKNKVEAERAAAVAAASLSNGASVDVPDKKVPRSKCDVCKGTGFVRHGDGHTTECPNCEPDKRDEVMQEEVPVEKNEERCCGPDCVCKDCECKDKECLEKCCGPNCKCEKCICKDKECVAKCGPECKCEKCECKDKECLKAAIYVPSDEIIPDNEDECYVIYTDSLKEEVAEISAAAVGAPIIKVASFIKVIDDKLVGKRCCDDCICDGNCECTYPGECLVKQNGGLPVKVCHGDYCTTYSPPAKEVKSDSDSDLEKQIAVAQDLMKHAARSYLDKDYEKSARYVEHAAGILNQKKYGDHPELKTAEVEKIQKRVNRAFELLKEQGVDLEPMYVIPKKEYDDFLYQYSLWVKKYQSLEAQVKQQNSANGQSYFGNGVYRSFGFRRGGCSTCQ